VLAALGIFCGAVGKSAQFPLHPWLPDAMQGPTTASSMIHAATMVAAGVFLVARCYPLFPQDALDVVGWVGAFTCFMAATIACVQWDLKAVLAYSTVSQLGLMFTALGAGEAAGGRTAGMAHLFTHAMFKCLLFLCAGAVIHACAGHQDLHRMGGLRKRMPVTAWASLAAVLAICGVPLFSGFYSKDAVLAAALAHAQEQGGLAWGPLVLACAGSLLTAGYMLRWWLKIFTGPEREPEVTHHAHDPNRAASAVLLGLSLFTIMFVWTADGWTDRALGAEHEGHGSAHSSAMILALVLLVIGAGAALLLFGRTRAGAVAPADRLAGTLAPLHRFFSHLWGFDRLEDFVFTRLLGRELAEITARLDLGTPARLAELESGGKARLEDAASLDGFVDGIGHACARLGRGGSLLHAGRLGAYLAMTSVIGAIALLWVLLR
jgi:NADH-quinone oxidoreductase subunit L